MKLRAFLPFLMIPVLIGAATLLGLPGAKTSSTAITYAQDGDAADPIVVTVEVTREVTREVTVMVTPTFTPIPPTPTAIPNDIIIDDDPFLGAADAPVKIVEFSDFQCGFCARFATQTLPLLNERYGDLIQFVYRDYPIFGDASVFAALATECANDQGKFWEYHNLIFENQASDEKLPLDLVTMTGWAERLELDVEEWNTCLESDDTFNEIVFDYQTGAGQGITGTPTFWVNGVKLVGAQPYEIFIQVIDEALVAEGIEPPPAPEG